MADPYLSRAPHARDAAAQSNIPALSSSSSSMESNYHSIMEMTSEVKTLGLRDQRVSLALLGQI